MDFLCEDLFDLSPFGQNWRKMSEKLSGFQKTSENEIICFISANWGVGLLEALHTKATNVSSSMEKLPWKCSFKDKQQQLPKPSNIIHKICIAWSN